MPLTQAGTPQPPEGTPHSSVGAPQPSPASLTPQQAPLSPYQPLSAPIEHPSPLSRRPSAPSGHSSPTARSPPAALGRAPRGKRTVQSGFRGPEDPLTRLPSFPVPRAPGRAPAEPGARPRATVLQTHSAPSQVPSSPVPGLAEGVGCGAHLPAAYQFPGAPAGRSPPAGSHLPKGAAPGQPGARGLQLASDGLGVRGTAQDAPARR